MDSSSPNSPSRCARYASTRPTWTSSSLDGGRIQGFKHFDKGDQVEVDHVLSEVSAKDYDALVIPGGLFNPDALRVDDQALAFTRGFFEAGKPVGAICHGPLGAGQCRRAAWPHRHLGAQHPQGPGERGCELERRRGDRHKGLVTSRTPKDLPAFCAKLVEEIAEGTHGGQRRSA